MAGCRPRLAARRAARRRHRIPDALPYPSAVPSSATGTSSSSSAVGVDDAVRDAARCRPPECAASAGTRSDARQQSGHAHVPAEEAVSDRRGPSRARRSPTDASTLRRARARRAHRSRWSARSRWQVRDRASKLVDGRSCASSSELADKTDAVLVLREAVVARLPAERRLRR